MKTVIKNKWGRNAQSHEIKAMLGLGTKAKLPVAGMSRRFLEGQTDTGKLVAVNVWVAPLKPRGERTSAREHRVRAQCPFCNVEVSAGRLFQHVCN